MNDKFSFSLSYSEVVYQGIANEVENHPDLEVWGMITQMAALPGDCAKAIEFIKKCRQNGLRSTGTLVNTLHKKAGVLEHLLDCPGSHD